MVTPEQSTPAKPVLETGHCEQLEGLCQEINGIKLSPEDVLTSFKHVVSGREPGPAWSQGHQLL